MTRAFCAAAHGDVAASVGFHAFGPILFVLTLAAIPICIVEIRRRRRFEVLHRLAFSSRVAWMVAGALAAFHIGRLVSDVAAGELVRSMHASVIAAAWRHLVGGA